MLTQKINSDDIDIITAIVMTKKNIRQLNKMLDILSDTANDNPGFEAQIFYMHCVSLMDVMLLGFGLKNAKDMIFGAIAAAEEQYNTPQDDNKINE